MSRFMGLVIGVSFISVIVGTAAGLVWLLLKTQTH